MTGGQIVIRSSPVALARRHRLLTGTLTPASTLASTPTLTPTATPTKSPTATPTPPRTSPKPSANVGEVAGGTAAGCLVVCCCCPCVLVEFLFLAVYKVPATVLRRIYHKRRKKMKKKKGLLKQAAEGAGSGVCEVHRKRYCDELSDVDLKEFEKVKVSIDGSADAVELDRQMWAQFHNSGFGRSLSQRHSFILE